MAQLTITEMRNLLGRVEQLKQLDEGIPKGYLDRLAMGAELLSQVKNLPGVRWDDLKSVEDIERAEALIHRRLELINEIEKHLATCGMTVQPKGKRARGKLKRAPRRSRAQVEYDLKHAQIVKQLKADLGLSPRGRIPAQDQEKLDKAVEKELKKQKIQAPAMVA